MAITYGAAGADTTGAGATSITPALPAGLAAGSFMLAEVWQGFAVVTTISTPAGWTKVGEIADSSVTSSYALYYRYWQSGDAAPTFTWTNAATAIAKTHRLEGVVASSPIGNTASTGSAANSLDIGPLTGITPASANSLVWCGAGRRPGSNAQSAVPNTNFTERTEISFPTTGTVRNLLYGQSWIQTTATATGNLTITCTNDSSGQWAGMIVEIKAAASGGPVDSGALDFAATSDWAGVGGSIQLAGALGLDATSDWAGIGGLTVPAGALDFAATSDWAGVGAIFVPTQVDSGALDFAATSDWTGQPTLRVGGPLDFAATSDWAGTGAQRHAAGVLDFAATSDWAYVVPGTDPRDPSGRLWVTTTNGAGQRVTTDPTGCAWRDGFMQNPAGRWLVEVGGRGQIMDALMRNPGTGALIVSTTGPPTPPQAPWHDGEYRLLVTFN